jgi:hypothetical protein
MPFAIKGVERLSEKIAVRLSPKEKAQLEEDAQLAGLSVGELVRRRYFGRPIVASADLAAIKELRRLGGLLKHVHQASGGAYQQATAAALAELKAAIAAIARGDK